MARRLGIGVDELPLDKLALAIDKKVRHAGDHALRNIVLRGGLGPSWSDVLNQFGRRHRMRLPRRVEEAELDILAWWVARFWPKIPANERNEIWRRMGGEAPPPEDVTEALQPMLHDPTGRATYLVTQPTLRILGLGMLPGVGGCLLLWRLGQPRDDMLVPAILEIARLRQNVLHRVTVGIVGSPSSGKDAAIAAIFGIESGNVNPVAGSTKTVEITRLPHSTALHVVNTPGMGDVVESVTEAAREVLELIDVYVYVVNAQGGVQAREKGDYQRCLDTGRPVLVVVNKIDTLKEEDRTRYLEDAQEKLGASDENFMAAAFDPLPQLADAPMGVDAVRKWVQRNLEGLGKDPTELPWVEGPTT